MQLADIVYQGVPFLKEMGLVYKITSPWYMKLCGTQVFKVESLIPQHSMHIIMVLHVTFVMEKLALRNANLNDTYLTSIVSGVCLAASVQRYSKESHTLVCFKVQRLNSTHSHALPYIHPFSILVMIVNVVED